MAKYLIQKSEPLRGEVEISGSKNAVLPIMAASLLTKEECTLRDVPALRDVEVLSDLIKYLGADVNKTDANTYTIATSEIKSTEAPFDLVNKMRASFLVCGPLLARTGKAKVYMPGGCTIGARPIELHLKGFAALGANVEENEVGSYVEITADKLVGANIYLDFPSVGATENIMMAATLAEGTTTIENAAEEPEIVDLANFLNKMGARVKGAGTETIKIDGVESLKSCNHGIIPDRIEAGTFMIAAAITRGDILIKNAVNSHVKAIAAKLSECGVVIEDTDEGMRVRGDVNPLVSTNIKTMPYPGFPTDAQSPFMAFLTTVEGSSVVIENIFENRFMHVSELNRMGANIKIDGRSAIVYGDRHLEGTKVISTDLRAGAAMVLAGLVAEGTTELSEIYHIERGYENFVEKFRKLGATIIRIDD